MPRVFLYTAAVVASFPGTSLQRLFNDGSTRLQRACLSTFDDAKIQRLFDFWHFLANFKSLFAIFVKNRGYFQQNKCCEYQSCNVTTFWCNLCDWMRVLFQKNTTNFFKLSIWLLLIIRKLHTCYSNISLCRIANPAQQHNTEHPPCWKQCKQMNICNDGETCCSLPSEPNLCLDIGVILCVEAHLRRNRSFLVEEMPIPSFNFVCFVQVPHMRLLLRTHFFTYNLAHQNQ